MEKGTLDSLYAENTWWDMNGDGKVDMMDMALMKAILWYRNHIQIVLIKTKQSIY